MRTPFVAAAQDQQAHRRIGGQLLFDLQQ